jgi:hypothetical protein
MWYTVRFAAPHIASIVVGALLLVAAWRRPLLARALYFALFTWAAFTNFWTATVRPHVYLEYASLAVLGVYRDFILGFFAEHIQLLVMSVAACQALVAFGLAVGRPFARIGLVGATCFLVAIAPLGVGSGFPSTLLLAGGAILLWRRSDALEGGLLDRIIRATRRRDRTSSAA